VIKEFSIIQEKINTPDFAPHRTQVGLFYKNEAGKLELRETVPVAYSGARTLLPELAGRPCPDFVYPNQGDFDYALFFLDDASRASAPGALAALEDPFTRRMVWGTLYAMVRREELPASEFLDLILTRLPDESDLGVLEQLIGGQMLREVFFHFLTPERRESRAARLEAALWAGLQSAEPGTDARLLWHDAWVGLTARRDDIPRLREVLNEPNLDQPRRWSIIGKLAQLGAPEASGLVDAELARDKTDQGERSAFGIRGTFPTLEAKEAQWERLMDPSLALPMQRAGSGSFHSPFNPELSEPFIDRWFSAVHAIDWEDQQHRIGVWFDNLIPPIYTPEFLARSQRELARHPLPPRALRAWREANDQIERVVAIRARDGVAPDGARDG
jgi:aminopeptidase N